MELFGYLIELEVQDWRLALRVSNLWCVATRAILLQLRPLSNVPWPLKGYFMLIVNAALRQSTLRSQLINLFH